MYDKYNNKIKQYLMKRPCPSSTLNFTTFLYIIYNFELKETLAI